MIPPDLSEPQPAGIVARRGALTGAAGGLVFGLAAGLAYAIANRDVPDVPWTQLGLAWTVYSIAAGALVAGGAASAVGVLDATMHARHWASPMPAAALGGALGCSIVGVIGGTYFGAMSLPFMGGVGVFAIPVAGAILVAIALAVQDRVQSGKRAGLGPITALALFVAALLGGVIALGAARVGDGPLLDMLRRGVDSLSPVRDAPTEQGIGLAALGALLGLGLGATLGAYVGVVMSVARRLR